MSDGARQLRRQQADQPVGLLHVAGDLGQVAVGGHADGAAQGFADVVADGLLDGERNAAGLRRLLLAAHQLADHLVDAGRVRYRAAAVYSFRDSLRVFSVDTVVAFDEDDLRADLFRLAHQRAGLDAERLGLVAGGNADRGVGPGGERGRRAVAIRKEE